MPELRQNRFTKEWVVIATERAQNPEELAHRPETIAAPMPSYVADCSFCPGNENLSTPEILRVPESPALPWEVRVVQNKEAALSRDAKPERVFYRSLRKMTGFGIHDVIIESPNHAVTPAQMTGQQVTRFLKSYKQRYLAVSEDPRVAHVTIFKNHIANAGAHPHSQMIATPVVSSHIRHRLHEALRHYDEFGECLFCQLLHEEMAETHRIVIDTEHFVALQMFAAPTPFSTHIYPKRHMASFGDITETEIKDLGEVMRVMLAKLYVGLGNPDYNYAIRTAPAESAGVKYYHWYITLIPRLTNTAGFELGSGMFINTVLPEAAAEFLRHVKIEGITVE